MEPDTGFLSSDETCSSPVLRDPQKIHPELFAVVAQLVVFAPLIGATPPYPRQCLAADVSTAQFGEGPKLPVLASQPLEGFAYRTTISPAVFLAGGVVSMALAWLATSWQAVRAALVNPVDALAQSWKISTIPPT